MATKDANESAGSEHLVSALIRILSILTLLVIWHLIGSLQLVAIPPPVETGRMLVTLILEGEPILGRTLQEHALASLIRVMKGSLAGFAIAIPLGIIIGWSAYVEKFSGTIVEIFRPIPPLAWIPLAFIIFRHFENTNTMVQIFIVFMGAFFPALLNTIHGVKSIDPIHLEAARTFGASSTQIFTKVIIPGALPSIITGIRIGLGVGWMCVVAAEMIGSSASGIGFFIWAMYEIGGGTAEIISGMMAIGFIGYLMNEGVLYISRRWLMPWGYS